MRMSKPIVGIPVDVKQVGIHPYHVVGEKYIDAVARGADCFPLLLPAMGAGQDLGNLHDQFDLRELVAGLDGIFLPGSASNVEPSRYGKALEDPGSPSDTQRDETTLEMIRIAVEEAVPLLAVCRGFQEMNVSFGGSLHQAVHEVPGFLDHREDSTLPRDQQYGHAHEIHLTVGGLLHRLLGRDRTGVNSVHGQGFDRLADNLTVEAVAPDGLVEAVSVTDARTFSVGVQWHAEWGYWKDDLSQVLFAAFGEAARSRLNERQ